jgi:hypothetical protein
VPDILPLVLTAVAAFAILGVVGLALVLNLAPKQRLVLFPAAPVLGAVVLVVLLHLSSLALPVNAGIWIVAALAVAALVAAVVRNRSWRFVPARSVVAAVVVVAVGAAGAVLTLLPSILAQSPLAIQPTAGNDAFYYVSVAQWVRDNALTATPDIGTGPGSGSDSPAYGPALESLRLGLRVGQELVNAGISTMLGVTPVATISPMLGVYVALLPGGAWVLGTAFRLPAAARVVLGALLVTSFSLISQTLNQNADSVLGIAFLPLVIGLCALVLFRTRGQGRVAPVWLAAAALAALVGTYTEYVPFLFAALGGLALIGPLATLATRVLRALGILGLSVLIGPVIWFRAVQGLLLAATLSSAGATEVPTALETAWRFTGPYQGVLRGFDPALGGTVTTLSVVVLLAGVGVGVVLALASSRTRGLAIGGAFVASAGAAFIAMRSTAYITGRAIDMVTPLLVIVAVLGWSVAGRWTMAVPRRPVAIVLTSLLVAAGVGGSLAGARVAANNATVKASDDRVVSAEFEEAAGWIDALGDSDGADVSVAVGTQFDQLWLSDALAELPDVSYINLRGDLGYRSDLDLVDFWDGEPDRYVLVGPGAYASYDPDALIESNTRFFLLDLTKDATVAIPVIDDGNWSWVVDASGAISSLKSARVQLLTSRADLSGVSLTFTGVAAGATLTLDGSPTSQPAPAAGGVELALADVPVVDGLAELVVTSSPDELAGFTLAGVSG